MEDTENMTRMKAAIDKANKLVQLLITYEAREVQGPSGHIYPLTVAQVDDLKADFAASRAECIAKLNEITG